MIYSEDKKLKANTYEMLFGNQKIFFLIKLRGMPRINDVGRDPVERDNQVGGTNLVGRPTRQG